MRRRLPRAERRAQLLDVATSRFGERGYHPTSMDDIAEAAGVTKPVLYQHFDSKEDLYIAVIERIGEVLRERIDDFAFEGASTKDRVREGIEVFFEVFDTRSSMLKLFFGSEYVTERVQEEVTRATSRAAESVGALLARARDLSPEEAVVVGRTFVTSVQAIAREADGASNERRELMLASLANLLTGGIRAFEPRDEELTKNPE
ncbi:TetR/AcrR family transcriptional regulator [Dermabacter sp. p3-SID358]|uniref:TetR/AcrR family transcriptional regulator n=1 Tax=Dermabacter sp. p3-SID358 TaxID=2916114 RepID=UPI0021A37DBF|nr:TetR/AcrR family transcriptional regulator [Dermabacter sp. p3-SID358]MCT1866654.1 TetR/AcrR family transcriptional regulator [Dermabacter sp. p3-SID358]